MKRLKYVLFLIIIPSVYLSCKKSFLESPIRNAILRQDYVVNLQTTEEYLRGIYTQLSLNSINIYPEIIADNIRPASSGSTYLMLHYNWSQIADNNSSSLTNNMNNSSKERYNIIRNCSFVIEKANEYFNQNSAKANVILGQAYAIRALCHFELVNIFAQPYNFTQDASHLGIAYITTSDWSNPYSRLTVAEVYTNIVSDLNVAISLLPEKHFLASDPTTLLINKNASKALLARVYLFKEDYSAAKNLAIEVSKAVPIMTSNYPSKLFTPQETEALFQLPPAVSATDGYSPFFSSYYFRSNVQCTGTSDITNLLNEFPSDLRRSWIKDSSGKHYIRKFPAGVIAGISNAANAYYHTVFRSSEMYLTAAEAYAKLNNSDSAIYYLDAIRKRAIPTAATTIVTGAALLDSIYKERRKELSFEGLRMYDLLRWKKGVNRGDALTSSVQSLSYPNNKAISPISTDDVVLAGIPQNPSY